jgi:hypothetical protein
MILFQVVKQIFFAMLLLSICFLPQAIFAETATSTLEAIQNFPTNELAGLNKTGISGSGTSQIQILLGRSIGYAVGFLGSLALCIILYAGVRFMISRGDEDSQKESLGMMLWAGIGITALLGSYSLVRFVFGIL